jgi:hypothetical protein
VRVMRGAFERHRCLKRERGRLLHADPLHMSAAIQGLLRRKLTSKEPALLVFQVTYSLSFALWPPEEGELHPGPGGMDPPGHKRKGPGGMQEGGNRTRKLAGVTRASRSSYRRACRRPARVGSAMRVSERSSGLISNIMSRAVGHVSDLAVSLLRRGARRK